MGLLWFLLIGLVVGALARLIIPGRQPMGILMTMALGVVGSLVGGLIVWIFQGGPMVSYHPARFIMSVVGAVLVLWAYGAYVRKTGRTL